MTGHNLVCTYNDLSINGTPAPAQILDRHKQNIDAMQISKAWVTPAASAVRTLCRPLKFCKVVKTGVGNAINCAFVGLFENALSFYWRLVCSQAADLDSLEVRLGFVRWKKDAMRPLLPWAAGFGAARPAAAAKPSEEAPGPIRDECRLKQIISQSKLRLKLHFEEAGP